MNLVDTHTHLDFAKYDADRPGVIKRAKAAFAFSSESVTSQGSWLGFSEIMAGSHTWFQDYLDKLQQVTVEDVEGEPGWYRVGLKVRPHFKYMGAFFTLSLVGKLEKE